MPSQVQFPNFKFVQTGDAVRVTLKDGVTTIDGNFRAFLSGENTILITTPVGEQDVDLQTAHYIDDYVQMVYPIPSP